MSFKINALSSKKTGLARYMLKNNKKAMVNPSTGGIIIKHFNKFVEFEPIITTPEIKMYFIYSTYNESTNTTHLYISYSDDLINWTQKELPVNNNFSIQWVPSLFIYNQEIHVVFIQETLSLSTDLFYLRLDKNCEPVQDLINVSGGENITSGGYFADLAITNNNYIGIITGIYNIYEYYSTDFNSFSLSEIISGMPGNIVSYGNELTFCYMRYFYDTGAPTTRYNYMFSWNEFINSFLDISNEGGYGGTPAMSFYEKKIFIGYTGNTTKIYLYEENIFSKEIEIAGEYYLIDTLFYKDKLYVMLYDSLSFEDVFVFVSQDLGESWDIKNLGKFYNAFRLCVDEEGGFYAVLISEEEGIGVYSSNTNSFYPVAPYTGYEVFGSKPIGILKQQI